MRSEAINEGGARGVPSRVRKSPYPIGDMADRRLASRTSSHSDAGKEKKEKKRRCGNAHRRIDCGMASFAAGGLSPLDAKSGDDAPQPGRAIFPGPWLSCIQ